MSGFSSMLSFATVTRSPSSAELSSSSGAIIRQGPHHSAQKSTSTGPSAPRTSVAKLWSVTVLVAMASDSPVKRLTAIWAFARRVSRHEFDELRSGGVEQRGATLAPGKDHGERLRIGLHLREVRSRYVGIRRRNPAGLEVDDRHPVLLHEEAIDRARDDSPVGQRRGTRGFAERARSEQIAELRVAEDRADLVGDLLGGRCV